MYSFIRKVFVLIFICLSFNNYSRAQANYPQPKLIVTIVIDQMRQDYLYRFWDLYGENGFKKLVNQGYNFANTHYDYYPTYTAAGHANIGTGALPSVNGIVANDWFDNALGRKMYCTEDDSVMGVGTTASAGQMSPKNLKSTTFGDELRLANNFRSRVFGISLKDRGAILPAGHLANGAYWLQKEEGNFITSTYYMADLPAWVKQFNRSGKVDKYLNQVWKPSLSTRTLEKYTDADNSPYEGIFPTKTQPTFPYNLREIKQELGKQLIFSTPFGNTLALDFAEALIKNEKLGKSGSGVPDLLTLSLSSTDYVGHYFGIRSMEVADTYIRLDKDLAGFITMLENQIGRGNFMIILTADHGGEDNANYLKTNRYEVGVFNTSMVTKDLKNKLIQKYGKNLIKSYMNLEIYLDEDSIQSLGISKNQVENEIVDFLKYQPGVKQVLIADQFASNAGGDVWTKRYLNGYSPERSGNLFIMLQPGWQNMSWQKTGTTHGSVYTYDTHVPLIFYGKNVPHGFTYDATTPSQIAATLSALTGITPPSGCVATPLVHFFK